MTLQSCDYINYNESTSVPRPFAWSHPEDLQLEAIIKRSVGGESDIGLLWCGHEKGVERVQ